MLVLIDNYDSFTYNLVQYFEELGEIVDVVRNDACSVADIMAKKPHYVVISPGPCSPNEAGISLHAVSALAGQVPILGVCLGHQCIAQAFGGKIIRANELMHGKTSPIHHNARGIFNHLPNPFTATRYHSLIVETTSLPTCFEINAWTQEKNSPGNEIMAIQHKHYLITGVQFHPESILTTHGKTLLKNFLHSTSIAGKTTS